MPAASASAGPAGRSAAPSKVIVAVVGRLDAEDDVAERRLAGAILAEKAVHLAGGEREVDVPQGDQIAETPA